MTKVVERKALTAARFQFQQQFEAVQSQLKLLKHDDKLPISLDRELRQLNASSHRNTKQFAKFFAWNKQLHSQYKALKLRFPDIFLEEAEGNEQEITQQSPNPTLQPGKKKKLVRHNSSKQLIKSRNASFHTAPIVQFAPKSSNFLICSATPVPKEMSALVEEAHESKILLEREKNQTRCLQIQVAELQGRPSQQQFIAVQDQLAWQQLQIEGFRKQQQEYITQILQLSAENEQMKNNESNLNKQVKFLQENTISITDFKKLKSEYVKLAKINEKLIDEFKAKFKQQQTDFDERTEQQETTNDELRFQLREEERKVVSFERVKQEIVAQHAEQIEDIAYKQQIKDQKSLKDMQRLQQQLDEFLQDPELNKQQENFQKLEQKCNQLISDKQTAAVKYQADFNGQRVLIQQLNEKIRTLSTELQELKVDNNFNKEQKQTYQQLLKTEINPTFHQRVATLEGDNQLLQSELKAFNRSLGLTDRVNQSQKAAAEQTHDHDEISQLQRRIRQFTQQ